MYASAAHAGIIHDVTNTDCLTQNTALKVEFSPLSQTDF